MSKEKPQVRLFFLLTLVGVGFGLVWSLINPCVWASFAWNGDMVGNLLMTFTGSVLASWFYGLLCLSRKKEVGILYALFLPLFGIATISFYGTLAVQPNTIGYFLQSWWSNFLGGLMWCYILALAVTSVFSIGHWACLHLVMVKSESSRTMSPI